MKQILILSAIALAAFACAQESVPATKSAASPPLPADVQSVTAAPSTADPAVPQQESEEAIVATGEFMSPVRSELSAKLAGRVGKLYIDEGSRVRQGEPLLELETDYVKLNLQKAEADADRAAAAEEDARRDLDRKKELIAKQSIPQSLFDRTQAAYDQARAAKAAMLAQAGIYRQQLSDSVLRSPIDGVIAEKRTNVGQRLGENAVALVVVQLSPLKLRFRVPEKYLAQVHIGQLVKATVEPYPGEVFQGKVTTIGGVIDPASRSFFVETEFANRDGKLRPGLFARVEMEPMGS